MIFHVIENFSERLSKTKRTKGGAELMKMHKAADTAHRSGKRAKRGGEQTAKSLSNFSKRSQIQTKISKHPGASKYTSTKGGRAAAFSALSDAGRLRRAAPKGRSTTPKGADFHKSYTFTKARTKLRKATGDKATRSKILKQTARKMIGHSKLMGKTYPHKLP